MSVSLLSPNTDNYHVGKGIVSIKLTGDADYVDVGNAPTFELTPSIDKLDHFSSRAGVKSKDKSIAVTKGLTLRLVLEEFTARNLGLALLGIPNTGDPGAVTIDIFKEDSIVAAVKLVETNEVGPKWVYELPEVEFVPSAALNPISDEWGQIEVSGDVLFQEGSQSFGTATGDFVES
jgi:hypothetical protein